MWFGQLCPKGPTNYRIHWVVRKKPLSNLCRNMRSSVEGEMYILCLILARAVLFYDIIPTDVVHPQLFWLHCDVLGSISLVYGY